MMIFSVHLYHQTRLIIFIRWAAGGFADFDEMGVSPGLWDRMITHYGIKSLLDVGCGKGVSTSWFVLHGLEFVQCVEGSHDGVSQSIVPKAEGYERVVEHDFSLGPWWPDRTVDAVWCVEFTEHVGRNFQPNYLTAFRSAALIFVTHSNWGGWHHVEVHDDDWWKMRWEAAGLVYSAELTADARKLAGSDKHFKFSDGFQFKNGAQHVRTAVQVSMETGIIPIPYMNSLSIVLYFMTFSFILTSCFILRYSSTQW